MNVIINNENVLDTDQKTLFGDEEVLVVSIRHANDLPNLLKFLGVFSSTSQARQAGRVGEVPKGWSVLKASRKVEMFLWNPS